MVIDAVKIIDLLFRFIMAVSGFTFFGWIGWVGIVLIALRFFNVISWPWWVAALPLEYGVLYCLYMTIDGALYRAGLKDVGGYARLTQQPVADVLQAERNLERLDQQLEQIRQQHANDPQARLKALRELNERSKLPARAKQELSYHSYLMSMHIQGRHTKPLNDCALCQENDSAS